MRKSFKRRNSQYRSWKIKRCHLCKVFMFKTVFWNRARIIGTLLEHRRGRGIAPRYTKTNLSPLFRPTRSRASRRSKAAASSLRDQDRCKILATKTWWLTPVSNLWIVRATPTSPSSSRSQKSKFSWITLRWIPLKTIMDCKYQCFSTRQLNQDSL